MQDEGDSIIMQDKIAGERVVRIFSKSYAPSAPSVPTIADVAEARVKAIVRDLISAGLSVEDAASTVLACAEDIAATLEGFTRPYQIRAGVDVLDEITASSAELAGAAFAVERGYPSLAKFEKARGVKINVVEAK